MARGYDRRRHRASLDAASIRGWRWGTFIRVDSDLDDAVSDGDLVAGLEDLYVLDLLAIDGDAEPGTQILDDVGSATTHQACMVARDPLSGNLDYISSATTDRYLVVKAGHHRRCPLTVMDHQLDHLD
jgi:hypothetical protein